MDSPRHAGLPDGGKVKQVKWHIRRAMGFGGSEIGTMVLWRRGLYAPFTSARTLVAEKLFRAPPDEDTADTRRGRVLEPVARDMFISKHLDLQRDQSAISRVTDHRHRTHRSMVGNPDDIFRDTDGSLVIVDYKCPRPAERLITGDTSRKVDESVMVSPEEAEWFRYACQLHQYRAILLDAMDRDGVEAPSVGMRLIRFNAWNGLLSSDEIPFDDELEREMKAVHDELWGYVLRGELPAPAEAPQIVELDLTDELMHAAERRALYSQISTFATKQAEAWRTFLLAGLTAQGRLGQYVMQAGPLLISGSSTLDQD